MNNMDKKEKLAALEATMKHIDKTQGKGLVMRGSNNGDLESADYRAEEL